MFFHKYKYGLLQTIRNKELTFWALGFTIILGTLFYAAFGNIYENENVFEAIPVAVVENVQDDGFTQLLSELSQGEDKLLTVNNTDKEKADELLKDGDIEAVITVDETISLSINSSSENISVSIISSIINEYNTKSALFEEIAKTNPEKLPAAIEAMNVNIDNVINEHKLTDAPMNPFTDYFYNLIAMGIMFGSTFGMAIAINSQANLSAIAARKCVSPAKKSVSSLADILAAVTIVFACSVITILYVKYVLGVELGDRLGMYILTALFGSIMSVSLGYAVGSIGSMGEKAKGAILLAITLFGGFLSGLMANGIRQVVENYVPFINRVNPAAILTDAFFSLTVYPGYDRYLGNIISMTVITVICAAAGIILTRRKKYASL